MAAALALGACAAAGEPSREAGVQPGPIDAGGGRVDAAAAPDAARARDGGGRLDAGASDGGSDAGACLGRLEPCGGGTCCGELTCGATTAGTVCCGGEGAPCATPDGSDCCGDSLLCVGGRCQPPGGAAPRFSAPYACGERWTYGHHSAEVRQALDFVRADGGATDGAPVLASAPGVATRRFEAGGAGNYVVVEHGDGWRTYYFHLSSFVVADGAWVARGDALGRVGSTGASSGPHLHYEQLHAGIGRTIHIEGVSLAPYPGSYFAADLVSENACSRDGREFSTWGADRPVHARPSLSSAVVTTLPGPRRVFIDCQVRGDTVRAEGYENDWWAHLRDQGGYLSNIYVNDPASHLPGVPDCP
ncbi:MAG: hypothetical protein SangKO_091350 [Sandaracinaceae bacterium]